MMSISRLFLLISFILISIFSQAQKGNLIVLESFENNKVRIIQTDGDMESITVFNDSVYCLKNLQSVRNQFGILINDTILVHIPKTELLNNLFFNKCSNCSLIRVSFHQWDFSFSASNLEFSIWYSYTNGIVNPDDRISIGRSDLDSSFQLLKIIYPHSLKKAEKKYMRKCGLRIPKHLR